MPTATPLVEVFSIGIGTVQTNVLSYVAIALPIALIIAGTFIAIKLGMKFFRRMAK